jgi:hypothetical protein
MEETMSVMLGRVGLRPHEPPPAYAVDRFENSIRAVLPADYRAFLVTFGGQILRRALRYDMTEATPWGRTGRVSRFLGLTDDPILDIEAAAAHYVGRIPDETIPIGADPADNLVLLGVEGMMRNQVMFADHEHRELRRSVAAMATDLETEGEDLRHMDVDAVIRRWRQRFGDNNFEYDNVYRVAPSFTAFLSHLAAD